MSYEDCLDYTFSKIQVERELRRHQADIEEFYQTVGYKDRYFGKEVLDYLNY